MENIKNIPDNEIQFLISHQLFLETLLMELRGKSISYSSYKKKQNEEHENGLIKEIELVEQSLTEENVETIEMLREELRTIRKAKMQGYLIRSRAQIIEDDEKPTNYFCNLEKHHYTSKIIPKLEKSNGTIINEQTTILREVKTFYENLYSSKDAELTDVDLKHILSNADIKKKLS